MSFAVRYLAALPLLLAAAPAVVAGGRDAGDGPRRPNILWIMSDDHAAHAVGAYGGRLAGLDPTPTLDALAADGVRFANAFCENSICVPSRATLLTGRYSHNHGLRTLRGSLPPDRQTVPRLMGAAGYETAMVGKWHLGAEPAAFDYYAVLPGQGQYFNPMFRVRGPKPWPKNTFRFYRNDAAHSSDAVTDLSLKWLADRRERIESGGEDRPFFLMHHFKAPHDNFENAERYDFLHEDADIPEPPTLRERTGRGSADPALFGTSVGPRNARRNMGMHMFVNPVLPADNYLGEAYRRYLVKYLRCVRGVDDNVARLLARLRETGELENTVVFYTSDQGFLLGEHDLIDKRWMYDPSLRIPLIVRMPESLGDAPRGEVVEQFVGNVDFAPTLLDLAGAAVPGEMDGTSFAPLLRGESQDRPEEAYYRYWMHFAHHDVPGHFGVRTPDHKLIFFHGLPLDAAGAKGPPTPPHWELYDLTADPHETRNVIADPAHAGTARRLRDRLDALKTEVGDTDGRYPEVRQRAAASWPVPAQDDRRPRS